MFFWTKITAPEGYKWTGSLETIIFETCLAEKVLVIPGGFFKAEGDPEGGGVVDESGVCYFRGTFAAAEEHEVVQGIERFGRSIRKVFGLEEV
jgi:DNA-binding transcriptional MocR family regulator